MSYDDVVDILDSAGHELELEVVRTEDKENVAPLDDYSRRIEKQPVAMETYTDDNVRKVSAEREEPPLQKEVDHVYINGVATETEAHVPEESGSQDGFDSTYEEPVAEAGRPSPDANLAMPSAAVEASRPFADVTTAHEIEVTPEGSSHRTVTREVTSDPSSRSEVTTETLSDHHGDTQLFSQRRQEFEELRSSPLGGGGGGGGSDPLAVGNMFQSYSNQNQTSSSTMFSSQTSSQVSRQTSGQVASEAPVIPVAPPPPPPDKQRPYSLPPLDFNILEAIELNKISLVGGEKKTQQVKKSTTTTTKTSTSYTSSQSRTKDGHTINANDEESRRFQMLMKAFQPPSEDEGILTPRRRKMFSSSSFYDEPKHIYPTVEEQVKLCKSIADSLSADTNSTSRGATMYIKRMKRSYNWVTEGPDPTSSESDVRDAESSEYEPTTPEVKSSERPPLKLVLDPRQLQDAMKLAKTGIYNEHNVVSPDICFDLVRDLNSPTGKGAQLFAKRKKKSEKWIVDENSVKEAVNAAAAKHVAMADVVPSTPAAPTTPFGATLPAAPRHVPANQLQELQERLNPRVKLIKSPWEAALESPHGSCDAAFMVVKPPPKLTPMPPAEFHETFPPLTQPLPPLTVNTTAAAPPVDMRLYSPRPFSPSTAPPLHQHRELPRSGSPYYGSSNVYKPKAPKGWAGVSGDQSNYPSSWGGQDSPSLLDTSFSSDIGMSLSVEPSFQRLHLDNLPNYNNVASAWGVPQKPFKGFKPVRPSSAVYSK